MNPEREHDAAMRLRALTRWEDEGGALAPSDASDGLDESTIRLLARLGAALLEEWRNLPAELQAQIVRRARTLGGADDRARTRESLAAFLRTHDRER